MTLSSEYRYRLYLAARAFRGLSFSAAAGVAASASLLTGIADSILPLCCLTVTAAGIYIGLERAVLRFPRELRSRFRQWFLTFPELDALSQKYLDKTLRGGTLDPDAILVHLCNASNQDQTESYFATYADKIDATYAAVRRDAYRIKELQDNQALSTKLRDLDEIKQEVADIAERYKRSSDELLAMEQRQGNGRHE